MDLRTLCLTVLVVLMAVVRGLTGEIVDMRRAVATVMKLHNDARRDVRAADMLQMVWNEGLAQQAAEYASRCVYRRPSVSEYGASANLYNGHDYVFGDKSVRRFVEEAVQRWIDHKDFYGGYDKDCGFACPYIQIINARSDKVGCAISTCERLQSGNSEMRHTSLMVCLYSPRLRRQVEYPYIRGPPCSLCPAGQDDCRSGLCSRLGEYPLPDYASESDIYEPLNLEANIQADALSSTEEYYLEVVHNNLREKYMNRPMKWDPYLDRWAKYIVRCEADYPGPRGTYTNFHRLNQGDQPYNVLYKWEEEGDNTHLRLEHGCRSPNEYTECNHRINILHPDVTNMACAARDCNDGTRQLVCLYDREFDRPYYSNGLRVAATEPPARYESWNPRSDPRRRNRRQRGRRQNRRRRQRSEGSRA